MKPLLLKLRYYLEIIALPAFAYLVIHLSGHGLELLVGDGHEEAAAQNFLENIFTVEILSGVLFLIFFTWLWHRPGLKKWIPCGHDHCHSELPIPHVLATIALCLHFFPEAGVRHELLHGAMSGETLNTLGLIGFSAHFLVDIIVAIVLSGYWKTKLSRGLNFLVIALLWVTAFFNAESLINQLPPTTEGVLFITSAFLLAMFVHRPHKPKPCTHCH